MAEPTTAREPFEPIESPNGGGRRTPRSGRGSPLWLWLAIALALVAGRIAVVTSPEGDTAFLSANDRSRWATVISLVDFGTYEIDQVISIRHPTQRHRRPLDSIDKVQHLGDDGRRHFYSSKPPVLATLVAAPYWLLRQAIGQTILQQPHYVPRLLLAIVNLPLLAIFCLATYRIVTAWIESRRARQFIAAGICLGTMLTPMAVSLGNHLVAAAATAVAMWVAVRAATSGNRFGHWVLGGSAAAFAAANELPALSMLVGWTLVYAWLDRRSIVGVAIGVAIVAAAFFGTNVIAHGGLRMPYAHRGDGETITTVTLGTAERVDAMIGQSIELDLDLVAGGQSGEWRIDASDEAERWKLVQGERWLSMRSIGNGVYRIAAWDDWYEYPGSYWQDGRRRGVDLGEPSRLRYAWNMMLGTYGVFLITPLWLAGCVGVWISFTTQKTRSGIREIHRWRFGFHAPPRDEGLRKRRVEVVRFVILCFTVAVTLVCVAFYLMRPQIDRNYGGVSCCFRWLLWLAPMWWSATAIGVETLVRSRRGRWLAVGLIAASVFSVSVAIDNPWRHPWPYRFTEFLGYSLGESAS